MGAKAVPRTKEQQLHAKEICAIEDNLCISVMTADPGDVHSFNLSPTKCQAGDYQTLCSMNFWLLCEDQQAKSQSFNVNSEQREYKSWRFLVENCCLW